MSMIRDVSRKKNSAKVKDTCMVHYKTGTDKKLLRYFWYLTCHVFLVSILFLAVCSGESEKPPVSVTADYQLTFIPESLNKMRGIHPRIYLNDKRIAELQKAIKTTHSALWKEIQAQADRAVTRGAPQYVEDDGWSGSEQLWQRSVGNTMPYLAISYVMTGDEKYLNSAREWALASCGYQTWGAGSTDGMDLAAGHQLYGLALIYDWCYNGLDEKARQTIRETLIRRTSAMFEAAATGEIWWQRSYMQNHLWVNITGMAAVGFALFDETENASRWIGLPLSKFQLTMDALGNDGASHEGVGYWEYGAEYMLKFMYLARELLGVNMYDHEWWRNTAMYCLYMTLPRNAWTPRSSIVDLADCPRSNWYGPDYLLRALAREYSDGYAQWLAQQFDEENITSNEAQWLNLIWYDPTLEPVPPSTKPSMHHFEDMGIVSARSDWSGDESLIVFKCGPYIGHKAVMKFDYDPGGGHVHPDANHFVIFSGGEWLIRDDGYQVKLTRQHNTLMINGRGQLGEGNTWFNGIEQLKLKARPRIVRAESTPEMDQITGDATEAYPRDIGLTRYIRHLLFLKPDVLIIVDDIVLDGACELELNFHPESHQVKQDNNTFLIQGKQTLLRLDLLTAEGIKTAAGEVAPGNMEHQTQLNDFFRISFITNRAQWRNAVALTWAAENDNPGKVTLKENGDIWTFISGDRTVAFNWVTGEAKLVR